MKNGSSRSGLSYGASHLSLFLQNILDSSTEYSIIGEDADGMLILWNEGARRNYGFVADELVGRENATILYPPEERGSGKHQKMREIALKDGNFEGIVERYRRDGSRFPARLVMTPRRATNGELLGFLTISKNIAEELRMEQARKEAEERVRMLNKELEAFSYSVSHDLRAPLRHINGFVDLLAENAGESLDPKCRRYLGTIADSAKQMGQLIDDLLVFSRMGRSEMAQRELDLNEVLQETLHKLQPGIQDRNIEWKIGSLPTVLADPPMLRQVFTNLLENAVKYSRDSDPAEIEVGATTGGDEVVIFVRDNGAGFEMEYVDKLFGVFQRLHRSDQFEGTGIGLANVKRIISRHRGRVWATGKLNEGATFYFSLPRQKRRTKKPQ